MAITQNRLIALIDITDSVLTQVDRQKTSAIAEVRAAIDAFYESQPDSRNALTNNLLSHLQAVEAIVSEPLLNPTAIATLATEREHFRITSKRNTLVAKAMKRSRTRRQAQVS